MVNLYDFIKYLEHGTKLHIGVLFIGNAGGDLTRLPQNRKIHSSKICEAFKTGAAGYRRCFRCRNMALRKAIDTKEPFGGYCVNGIYEYTHPIVKDGEVCAVVFIGNILVGAEENTRLLSRLDSKLELIDTLEEKLTPRDAEAIAGIVDGYVRCLLDVEAREKSISSSPLIENIKDYIRANSEFNVTTSHISSVFHYNKSYLGRLFKREAGMSISEYLCRTRIEAAKPLLCDTRASILEISEKLGFSGVSHFNRLFKDIVGSTPTEYRRENSSGIGKQ